MSALPSSPKDKLLRKLHAATDRPINIIRELDPCGCNESIDDVELLSLYLYTTNEGEYSYRPINNALSTGSWKGTDIGTQIECIDSALNSLSIYSGDCYRTEEEGGRIHTKAKHVLALKNPASADEVVGLFVDFFMSSSLDRALKLRGSAVEIVIINTTAGRNITHLSRYPNEYEVLFKRDSHFVIVDVEKNPGSFRIFLGEL